MTYKKIISLLLCCVMLFGMAGVIPQTTAYAGEIFNDVDDNAAYTPFLQLLKALDVISGDGDGNFRPNDGLTRAEFAKLAVHMLDKKDAITAGAGSSAFKDLSSDHWAVGYISYVVKNALIIGFPDGTFQPNASLTYAQAITVVLRMLGYSSADIGAYWPDSYIQKADALGLTAGMWFDADAPIPRCETVIILGRALETDMNSAAIGGAKSKLIGSFGYTIIDETTLISTNANNKSYKHDEVQISEGRYKTLTDSVFGLEGQLVKLYLNDEKKIVLALPLNQYSLDMTIEKRIQDNIYLCITADGAIEYEFDDMMTVYFDGATVGTAQSLRQNFVPGARISLHGKYDGRWDYAVVSKADKLTPTIVPYDITTADAAANALGVADANTVTVYRNGLAAQISDIKQYDVAYYNRAINTLDIYSEKVTGIYNAAYPSKAYATSIDLNGERFTIESAQATAKLDETSGSYKIGDKLTILLGKDGEIAGTASLPSDITYNRKVVTFVAGRDVTAGETSINGIAINPAGLSIYRDGLNASMTDIKQYDVVYYNEYEKTLEVYIDKVSGVYNKAFPNKAYVTSIELGGKVYEIENCGAAAKLDETAGSFKIGDRITLLLGKGGKIAGVANVQNSVILDYGVVVNTTSETSDDDYNRGQLEYYASIFMGDEQTYRIKTDKNYSNLKGKLVHLSYSNGICTLKAATDSSLYGNIDTAAYTIGGKALAKDIVLFDLVSNNSGQNAVVKVIKLSDITQTYMYSDDIISYASNSGFGDIGVMMLKNLSASNMTYGVVTYQNVQGSQAGSTVATYRVQIDGTEHTVSGSTIYSVSVGQPVGVTMESGRITKLTPLIKIASASKLDAIDFDRIKIGGVVYNMEENAPIYRTESATITNKFITIPQSALTDSKVIDIQLYSDRSLASGGKVRVIKVVFSSR